MRYIRLVRLNNPTAGGTGFAKLASFVIVAAVLSVAKEVFIPIALATLLSFLLAPLVVRLGRCGFGKIFSILLTVSVAFSVIGVICWLVMAQVIQLADQLPKYQENVRTKIQALKQPNRRSVIARTTGMVKELQKELNSLGPDDESEAGTGRSADKPLSVEIKSPPPSPVQIVANIVGPILKPLGTAGAVVFFVILMLFQREDLRERFLKLVSGGEWNVATQAVDDATQRVSRYLLMQLIVNATYGIPIGIGLYFIGVPNAFLWGLLAAVLRFIPFLGPWIAAAFPITLAFAVEPGWSKPALTVGLFLAVEVLSNNIVEPWLYGASTGVSNIALLMAAIFWTWLWGTPGLLLSTPLTVCLLVLGKYVPGLSFLSVLLGSDPVLEPEARFYQRMLAMDEDELVSLAEKYVRERSLPELYDKVIVPALSLAEQDRHKGSLAEVRQAFIVQSVRDLIETLGERASEMTPPAEEAQGRKLSGNIPPVLCLPARDEADELAALMLGQLLEAKGLPSRVLPAKALATEWIAEIKNHGIKVVCISGIPPFAVSAARHTCKPLKEHYPDLNVVVGVWNAKAPLTDIGNRLGPCTNTVVTHLGEAVLRVQAAWAREEELSRRRPAGNTAPVPTKVELPEPAEPDSEEVFTSIARQVAKILNVPVSLVSLVDNDPEFWKGHGGLPAELSSGESFRETPVCNSGSTAGELFVMEDVKEDSRLSNDPLLQARGIQFWARIPLRAGDRHLVGTLCVTDTQPHRVSDRAKALLQRLADRFVETVEQKVLESVSD